MTTLDELKTAFTGSFNLKQKRPNLFQIQAPFFHEDGDMVEMFVEVCEDGRLQFCDYGLTLMHLSYNQKLTESKDIIWSKILAENHLESQEGNFVFTTNYDTILNDFFHYAQTLGKISALEYLPKSTPKNQFINTFLEYIEHEFSNLKPQLKYTPIHSNSELVVDAMFERRVGHPIYLFGVKSNDIQKPLEIAANCFEFKTKNLIFQSAVVYENFDTLSDKHRKRILRATDKQFLDFEQFQKEGYRFIDQVA